MKLCRYSMWQSCVMWDVRSIRCSSALKRYVKERGDHDSLWSRRSRDGVHRNGRETKCRYPARDRTFEIFSRGGVWWVWRCVFPKSRKDEGLDLTDSFIQSTPEPFMCEQLSQYDFWRDFVVHQDRTTGSAS